jgi:hypothetical protein
LMQIFNCAVVRTGSNFAINTDDFYVLCHLQLYLAHLWFIMAASTSDCTTSNVYMIVNNKDYCLLECDAV